MPAPPSSDRGAALRALTPLALDVVVPVALYSLLSGLGVGNTPALLAGGVVPFARSLRSILRDGAGEHLALMMAALFLTSLVLVALTGSPKFLLAKESMGTAVIGLWCLGSAWTRRPMTFYTARPLLTGGRPAALRCWDALTDRSAAFQSIQRRLAILWGIGLLVEASVRIGIVERYPVHTAAALVNVAAAVVITALCVVTGPLGGLELRRLLAAAVRDGEAASTPVAAAANAG